MSLFNCFQRTVKETNTSKLCDSMKEELPESITQREMECIWNNLQQVDTKKKRCFVYEEKDKQDVAKYAAQCGTRAAIRKFKPKFPNLKESTVWRWLKKYGKIKKKEESKKWKHHLKNWTKAWQPITSGRVRFEALFNDHIFLFNWSWNKHTCF